MTENPKITIEVKGILSKESKLRFIFLPGAHKPKNPLGFRLKNRVKLRKKKAEVIGCFDEHPHFLDEHPVFLDERPYLLCECPDLLFKRFCNQIV